MNILGWKIGNLLRNRPLEAKYLAVLLKKDIDREIDPFVQVGWAMWRTNIFTIKGLYEYMTAVLEKMDQKELLTILFPSWVDPWSALWVPIAAERPPGERAIMLNSQVNDIVNCFVRRAYCCFYDHHLTKMIIDMSCYSNDGTPMSDLIKHIRWELLKILKIKEQELETRLSFYTTRFGPVFVVLPLPGLEDIAQLMKEFRYVTFFFLTNGNFPEDVDSFEHVIFPQPALREEDINAYHSYCQFIYLGSLAG